MNTRTVLSISIELCVVCRYCSATRMDALGEGEAWGRICSCMFCWLLSFVFLVDDDDDVEAHLWEICSLHSGEIRSFLLSG